MNQNSFPNPFHNSWLFPSDMTNHTAYRDTLEMLPSIIIIIIIIIIITIIIIIIIIIIITIIIIQFVAVFKTIKQINSMYLTWGECDDRHRKCSHWRSRGLCEKKAKRMDRWCPWACHKCVPEKLGEIYIYMQ